MLIENFIPFGYKNRISRYSLSSASHLGDRKMRKEIENALIKRNVLIINIDDGYFRPDGSLEDKERTKMYLMREQARASSCNKRCKAILKCLALKTDETIVKGQLSFLDYEMR